MGNHDSKESRGELSAEFISSQLAARFSKRCFTNIELFSFKEVFKSLAEHKDGVYYWKEDTLCRFLEIPDALDVCGLIFQAASFLGAFPFLSAAPVILNFEAMVKVVAILTGKYAVAVKGQHDPIHLLFRAFSEYDRGLPGEEPTSPTSPTSPMGDAGGGGFAIGGDSEDDDEDEMALAALDALDAIEAFKHAEKSDHKFVRRIKLENLTRLLMLLILVAPLDPQESLAVHGERCSLKTIGDLRSTAEDITRSMTIDGTPVIFPTFERSVRRNMPYLFDGLRPLFEHMLFSKSLNPSQAEAERLITKPKLLSPAGNLMNHNTMCQLSFFLKGDTLWRKLRQLYVGSVAGFSMGSFEQKVFNWQAPTILLVAGSRMPNPPETSREKSFNETLAPKRYPDGIDVDDGRLVFGAYIPTPWKKSAKDCFGDSKTKLFQLSPVHEVFETSSVHTEYCYFNRDAGVGFGAPVPKTRPGEATLHMNLGPVSLILEDGLEFGVFTHSIDGGGAFHCSDIPHRKTHWQDRFEIEELEVWGIGGDAEAALQAKQWAWEEREAMARRNVNLGDDLEANRALLEMAGLIGGNRSGGSV